MKNDAVDFSVGGGVHFGHGDDDTLDTTGVDLTFIGSGRTSPGLEPTARSTSPSSRSTTTPWTTASPPSTSCRGWSISLRDDVDFVAELGIGIADESSNYVTAGVAVLLPQLTSP